MESKKENDLIDYNTNSRHVVVVGASRGLGSSVVDHFAKSGWRVSFGARNVSEIKRKQQELLSMGYHSHGSFVDVDKHQSVRDFFDECKSSFGEIHSVIHLSATNLPFGKIYEVNPEEWVGTIRTNLFGAFYVLRESVLHMLKNNGGDIVVLSGGGATSPMPTMSAYAASKSALVRLVETVAIEVQSSNIRVNALAPGIMKTTMLTDVLKAGSQVVDENIVKRMVEVRDSGEDSQLEAIRCIEFLLTNKIPELSGLLVSAKWDPWEDWMSSETNDFTNPLYRIRRVVPTVVDQQS